MASAEDSFNPQQQQPLQSDLQTQLQPSYSNLPQYPEMILAAVEALNEKTGSSKAAISNQMESTQPDLPPAHTTLLTHHLNKMMQSGQLVMVKNNYMKPDPNAPPKRGRGRPPKPKDPLAPATVVSPPRPRGRPPKPRDPFALPAASQKKSSGGSGRPRGRPPKKAKTDPAPALAPTPIPTPNSAPAPVPAATSSASAPATGAPRGRGRPPKVKPAVAPVAG